MSIVYYSVAALLFKLEAYVRIQQNKTAVRNQLSAWNRSRKRAEPAMLQNIDFKRPSLFNSRWYSANADVIVHVKSKIIASRRHFFADVISSAISKVQKYQNKTGEKFMYLSKYVLTAYFKEF